MTSALTAMITEANALGWRVTLQQQRHDWLCRLTRPASTNPDGIINTIATAGARDPASAILYALASSDHTLAIPAGASAINTTPTRDLLATLGIPATRSGPPLRR